MGFMKPKVDRAVETMRNDPDIVEKFRAVEFALQELKIATEREQEFYNSESHKALSKKYGYKDWA
jgi:dimeric dUTPase (all-alpha-NTP-PPase superfamily)